MALKTAQVRRGRRQSCLGRGLQQPKPTGSATALDLAGNGCYARKVVIACKRERGRGLHTVAPAEFAELANRGPSALVVNVDDTARALASALA